MIFPPVDPASLMVMVALSSCPKKPPPTVALSFTQKPATYDNTRSTEDLSKEEVSTKVARKPHEVFVTGGLTSGKIKAGFRVNFRKMVQPETGAGCLWIDNVEVMVDYDPTVYIAREYAPGTCRYNVVADHEQRHVSTDLISIQEYNVPLRDNMQRTATNIGSVYAANENQMQALQKNIIDQLQNTMNTVMTVAETVRNQRQQKIDTRQEYLRTSRLCP